MNLGHIDVPEGGAVVFRLPESVGPDEAAQVAATVHEWGERYGIPVLVVDATIEVVVVEDP